MNKKVLITGAGGFIGSHLADLCLDQGFDVRAFVHYNSQNKWGWLDNSPEIKSIEIVTGDLRDADSVFNAMRDIEIVFHLGALIGIPYSYISPAAYIKTNIEGTYNILEAARRFETKEVIITSTSEVYGTAQFVPISENHPLNAQSPYAATKIAADQLALSYFRSFGTPVKIVRPFNAFGPRQSARAIIPTVITQILSNQLTIELGSLHPTRDFTYVKDLARGFLAIAECEELWGQVTNVGMNAEIAISDLVALISEIMGIQINVVTRDIRKRASLSEVERLRCDNSKLTSFTGWKPQYTLKSGLEETVEWFKLNKIFYKGELYNV